MFFAAGQHPAATRYVRLSSSPALPSRLMALRLQPWPWCSPWPHRPVCQGGQPPRSSSDEQAVWGNASSGRWGGPGFPLGLWSSWGGTEFPPVVPGGPCSRSGAAFLLGTWHMALCLEHSWRSPALSVSVRCPPRRTVQARPSSILTRSSWSPQLSGGGSFLLRAPSLGEDFPPCLVLPA